MASLLRTIERAALRNNPQLWKALPEQQRRGLIIKRILGYCVSAIKPRITSRKTLRKRGRVGRYLAKAEGR